MMGKTHLIYDTGHYGHEEPHMMIACGLDWDVIKDWSPEGVDCTEDESKVTCKNCIKCVKGKREYADYYFRR